MCKINKKKERKVVDNQWKFERTEITLLIDWDFFYGLSTFTSYLMAENIIRFKYISLDIIIILLIQILLIGGFIPCPRLFARRWI